MISLSVWIQYFFASCPRFESSSSKAGLSTIMCSPFPAAAGLALIFARGCTIIGSVPSTVVL